MTNTSSDTQVEYGQTASYAYLRALNSSLVTPHSQLIIGLAPNTWYFRMRSRDGAGNLAVFGNHQLKTCTH
jgi:hypothetical protein